MLGNLITNVKFKLNFWALKKTFPLGKINQPVLNTYTFGFKHYNILISLFFLLFLFGLLESVTVLVRLLEIEKLFDVTKTTQTAKVRLTFSSKLGGFPAGWFGKITWTLLGCTAFVTSSRHMRLSSAVTATPSSNCTPPNCIGSSTLEARLAVKTCHKKKYSICVSTAVADITTKISAQKFLNWLITNSSKKNLTLLYL